MKKTKEEKRIEEQKQQSLKYLRNGHIPEPTIIYNIGDRVQHGNIKQSIVCDVLDDGNIIELDEICTENNYGKPYDYTRKLYVSWLDVVPYKAFEEQPNSLIKNKDVMFNYSNTHLLSILMKQYKEFGGIDLNPEYQRDHVWDLENKIKLIDSIFNNVDIGKFLLISRTFENGKQSGNFYEVVDGKQRITALLEFYENRFQYNGYYYKDLCNEDQRHFTNYTVGVMMLDEKQINEELILKYFLMVNIGGIPQDEGHIKKVEERYKTLTSK